MPEARSQQVRVDLQAQVRSLAAACALAVVASAQAASTLPGPQPAAYAVAVNGKITESRAAHVPRQPASLAKLATALVLLERFPADSPEFREGIVAAGREAASERGARLGLRAADHVPLRELFAAMLAGSANDACRALVEHASHGDAAAFVDEMNRLAAAIGMLETRFADPCGHDRAGQHTSAADLMILAHAAFARSAILDAARRPFVQVRPLESDRLLTVSNTNALLGRYHGAFGLKTGYTAQAGGCVIGAARLGRATVVVVILGSANRWYQAVGLMNRAFEEALPMPRGRTPETLYFPDD